MFSSSINAFRPFSVIFSVCDAPIGSEVVWNDKAHPEKSFFCHVWWIFIFLKQKMLKNEHKIVENHVFYLPCKKTFFANMSDSMVARTELASLGPRLGGAVSPSVRRAGQPICPSVPPSVRSSVRPFVRPSVCPSVCMVASGASPAVRPYTP